MFLVLSYLYLEVKEGNMIELKIPFKYCRIERAADLLGCKIEDLVTLGVENRISLNLMLDAAQADMSIRGNIDAANAWMKSLKPTTQYMSNALGVTNYSYFSFDVIQSSEHDDYIRVPEFNYYNERNDYCLTCLGRAYGLWILFRNIDALLNYKVVYLSGMELTPCLPDENNIANQLMLYQELDKNEDEMTDDEFMDSCRGFRVTDKDLWITSVDIIRLINCKGDYSLLDESNENNRAINNIATLDIHPTAKRHSVNREQILMAAMRFREQQNNVFNETCRKNDGSINYAAWARAIIERPAFFLNQEIPIKTETKIAEILINAHKSPEERK